MRGRKRHRKKSRKKFFEKHLKIPYAEWMAMVRWAEQYIEKHGHEVSCSWQEVEEYYNTHIEG